MQSTLRIVLTFDHLGGGQDVGLGRITAPDTERPDLTVAMPRLLDLLDEVEAHGTFYIEGWSILHFPEIVQALQHRGHAVGLHGWVHEYPWGELTTDQRTRILHDGFAALRNAGAIDPGFRAPAGYLANDDADLLVEIGFDHGSSLLTADDDGYGATVLGNGLTNVSFPWEAVDYWQFALHPSDPADDDTWIPRWRELVAAAKRDRRETLVFVVHPFFACVEDGRFAALAGFLHELSADPQVSFATVRDVCDEARGGAPRPVVASSPRPDWLNAGSAATS